MADQLVLRAQQYLNSMYGSHGSWVDLEENGLTGTVMIEGLVRAFQIQNNVPNVTGYLGPYTIQVMKNLPKISKMDPEDEPDPNVCLIQCALFCKGYNAGGVTGIYYTTGENAVKEMQEDANIGVTGVIDWKVWAGLFSMYWFKLVSGGNTTIQTIQRQLNKDWSDVIGVQACDGVMSRNTALSLLGALQAAEGIVDWIDDLSSLNFGPATTDACPKLKQGVNGANIKFNKISQYGLYFNGINQNRFDGIFDSNMATNVTAFQKKYGLTGMIEDKSGEIGVSTMKSLLTSKGDTDRIAIGCDCSTILNTNQAKKLYDTGYKYVGRYLTGTVGSGAEERSKQMTVTEIKNIRNAGLSIFPIYQDGGYYPEYFNNALQGGKDAVKAISRADRLGFKDGTVIYFAVDFDCLEYQTDSLIIPYFRQINTIFNTPGLNPRKYKVGIYAPRYVCTKVSNAGYAEYSFVADMSTGFSGNLGYPIPENWAFDQFYEYLFPLYDESFDLDKVGVSGRDEACKDFDDREEIGNEDLVYDAKLDYLEECFQGIGFDLSEKLPTGEINFNHGEYDLGTGVYGGFTVSGKLKLSSALKTHSSSHYTIGIEVENGKITPSCEAKINEVTQQVDDSNASGYISQSLTNLALGLEVGNISFEVITANALMTTLSFICETDKLYEKSGVEGTISIEVELTLMATPDMDVSLGIALVGTAAVVSIFAMTVILYPPVAVSTVGEWAFAWLMNTYQI